MSTTTAPPIIVDVSNTQNHLPIDRGAIAELIQRALRFLGTTNAMISVAVVDDATIHEVNRRFLGHDWPTDVITFPLSSPDEEGLGADLIVSGELAAATARQAGTDPIAELALYLVHGLLHAHGYDDQAAQDVEKMRAREVEVLAALGLPCTFATVGEGPSWPD